MSWLEKKDKDSVSIEERNAIASNLYCL